MSKSTSIVLVLLILSAISCNRQVDLNKEIKKIIGSEIFLIDSLKSFSINKGFHFYKSKNGKLKIATYINGSCPQCLFELEEWKRIIEDQAFKEVSFHFYIKTTNINQMISILKEISFDYPTIIDTSNQFFILNKLSEDKNLQTFLLNENNKIVIVGNPIYGEQIKDFYLKVVTDY